MLDFKKAIYVSLYLLQNHGATGRQIELLAGFADKVLSAVPCVVYNNRGDDGSTLKLREMFNGILERE